MNILITGSEGFIGKNLIEYMKKYTNHKLFEFCKNTSLSDLNNIILEIDYVYHLAGVNRTNDINLFQKVNVGLTKNLCEIISANKKTKLIFASSKQATLDNPYGISKRKAEDICKELSVRNKNKICIVRLPGVFGNGCKPNYNSVVATFCFNIANDIDIKIFDKNKSIELIYINDLCNYLIKLSELEQLNCDTGNIHGNNITIIELANLIKMFKYKIENNENIFINSQFESNLLQTFKGYLTYKQNQKNY